LASVNTLSELTVVFILEIREGKFLYIETAEAICRGKIRDFRHKQISSNHIDTYTAKKSLIRIISYHIISIQVGPLFGDKHWEKVGSKSFNEWHAAV